MKVSIVLPNLNFGGAERLHLNLAEDWIKKGHQVEFVLMQKEGEYLSLVSPKINIVSLKVSRLRNIILPLARYLRKSSSDIVLVAMWPLTSYAIISWLLSGRIGKIFVSDHVHLSVSNSEESYFLNLFLKYLIRFTYPIASGVIAVSRGVRKDLSRVGNINVKKIKVIYNPIAKEDPCFPASQDERIKVWGGNCFYNILTVAELKKEKDHEMLIEAFSLLPSNLNAKLIILGAGQLRDHLISLIGELNLTERVELPGFVHDPSQWYRTADLFVLSSRWEGFGNVIVEALECGVPVVSTMSGGPTEILNDGAYGKLVPVGDCNALATAMEESFGVLHDHDLLRNRAQDFSISLISDKYLNYFATNEKVV